MPATIDALVQSHQSKELLRFLTCGSVDDGKSTLIGRLLHDTDMVPEDHLAAVARDSEKHGTTGKGRIDLALITDGLRAEREQGITIDVAYRYVSTRRRSFIIADCPGHQQYTRNMATGASTCDLAIILVDARHGVQEQTRRHSCIVSLLGIRSIVLAVNKMDLVGWDRRRFERIRDDYLACASRLEPADIVAIPVSALNGDNVAHQSAASPWYAGPTLLRHLESVPIGDDAQRQPFRFPVQLTLRPHLDFRGFAGSIASGCVRIGDTVIHAGSRRRSTVRAISVAGDPVESACAPEAVVIQLADEIDCSRGDMLAHPDAQPTMAVRAEAMLVWMHDEPLRLSQPYLVRTACGYVPGLVTGIAHAVDVDTLGHRPAAGLELNQIARVGIEFARPIPVDRYATNRPMGSFVLVDRATNATVAAGMLHAFAAAGAAPEPPHIARRRLLGHAGAVVSLGIDATPERMERTAEALLQRGIVAIWLHAHRLPGVDLAALAEELVGQGHLVLLAQAGAAMAGDPAETARVIAEHHRPRDESDFVI